MSGGEATRASQTWARAYRLAVWAVSALLYAYAVLSAIAHLIALGTQGSLTPVGWAVLLFGAVLPALVFALALVLTRRARATRLLVVMIVGLGVVGAFRLSLIGYSILNLTALVSV